MMRACCSCDAAAKRMNEWRCVSDSDLTRTLTLSLSLQAAPATTSLTLTSFVAVL